jgi:hypothetical protein
MLRWRKRPETRPSAIALGKLQNQIWLFRRKTYYISSSTTPNHHEMILEALESEDCIVAERIMSEHISEVRKKLVDLLVRQQYDAAATRRPLPMSRPMADRPCGRSREFDPSRYFVTVTPFPCKVIYPACCEVLTVLAAVLQLPFGAPIRPGDRRCTATWPES